MRIRTGFSFRTAYGRLEDVLPKVLQADYGAAPISDRSSTFGWVRWNQLCKKNNIRPIFGVEIGVTRSINEKRPRVNHWTFFAISDIASINRLIRLATQQFRYEPLLTYEQANQATDVLKVIGSSAELERCAPDENTFVALSPSCSKGFLRQAEDFGFRMIASSDNVYPSPEFRGAYEVLVGKGAKIQTYPQWILSKDEWIEAVRSKVNGQKIEEALDNLRLSVEKCQASLKRATLVQPNKTATLRELCEAGARKLGCDLSDPRYSERLERELEVIKLKEFEDYFFIIADIMQFARSRMVCGPARGSSAGSLVCYLLEITTIDPLKYGLIFERFIDITRNDLPDIDLDFSDQKRHLVFEYINSVYGSEHVARLGTFATYRPRSALTEAANALGIPHWKIAKVLDAIVERSSGDSRAMFAVADTLTQTQPGQEMLREHPEIMVATALEGHPRHYSQHAAGVVITREPTCEIVAVDSNGVAMCDKKDAEDLGMLKIDALGLTQLSVFEDAMELAGKRIVLDDIPTDDPDAFNVLAQCNWAGVFQFNGLALQNLTRQVKVSCLEDIISITALARPGPLTSGGAATWIRRRNGSEPVTYPHPAFKPYLENTLGVVMYQEQVMEICRKIGDLSWEDVTALRKAMSKSLGKEYFSQFGDRFKQGAVKKGIPLETLHKLWDDLCAYGAWAFNRSHSVAYGLVSYWCCWFKAHYPYEFAAATLSHEHDPERQIQLLRELASEGIHYIPVDKDLSEEKWSVGVKSGKRVLIGPLSTVNGIGPRAVKEIISARVEGRQMPGKYQKLFVNPRTPIDSLWPIADAFKRLLPDPTVRNIWTRPTPIIEAQLRDFDQEFLFFCTVAKINIRDENETINVVKRGGRRIEDGLTTSLNLILRDDTDTIFGKVTRWDYERIGKEIVDRGGVNKSLYAMKGLIRARFPFRMFEIKQVRYIGEL